MAEDDHPALLREAAAEVARALRTAQAKIIEKTVEREFNAALARLSGRRCAQGRPVLPNWNPQPGPFDSVLGDPQRPEMVGELKWSSQNKVFEVLWDAIKVCSPGGDPIPTAFLAYGFPHSLWEKPVECASMFASGKQPLVGLIRQHIGWWDKYILGDSTGRPTSASAEVGVTPVADESIIYQGVPWILRVVAVVSEGETVPFADGRPLPQT